MKKRMIALTALALILLLALTGCSSGSQKSVSLGVVIAAKYVDDESFTAFTDGLIAALPDLNTEETSMSVQSVPTGDAEKDPMGTMAGMTKITAMMAAHEIDLMICDPENARRHGDNGETYMALAELFTEEEIGELGITGVTLPIVDDETAELTGEMTHEVGVDLSGSAKIRELFPIDNPAVHIIAGTQHVEASKEAVKYLLTLP